MAGDGYAVDRAALAETAKGFNDVIGQLTKLGFSEEAYAGRGFTHLEMSQQEMGEPGLTSAFKGFCDRWSWDVRTLVRDGNQFAQRLGLCAGLYNHIEDQITGACKDLTASVVGDPHMTSQQAESASWSQDAAMVTGAHTPEGDMTPGQGVDAVKKQWETVGQEAMNTPDAKLAKDLASGG